ncbi:MAG: cellulase family glycosylhydrolase [bacterium]|nr:cellulase family glycosylhydrolase [bacterium]
MFKKSIKHLFSKGVAVALSAALVATSFSRVNFQEASAAGDLAEDLATFDEISASEIADVMSPGWNLGNQLESAHTEKKGGVWYNYPTETEYGNPVITKGVFAAVKAAGFKSVRIPVSYFDYIGDAESGYEINAEWMARVQEVVDMAIEEGLYVVINMHGDGYNSIKNAWLLCNADASKQDAIKEKYKGVWTNIATTFKDYDEHLIFEGMNEEFDGVTYDGANIKKEYYDNINDYNQIFIDAVRQSGGNNDSRWLVITGWNTDIEFTCGDYGFKMPTDTYKNESIEDGRLMLSVHYYAPWGFCGGEDGNTTQWGSYTTNSKLTASTDESGQAAAFNQLKDSFTSKGVPVFIGEFGSIDKTEDDPESNTYRAYFAQKVCENAKRIGAVPMYWDNGYNGKYGFGLFDRTVATEETPAKVTQQSIIDAMMDVYKTETSDSETTIALDTETADLKKSETVQLKATLTPADATDTVKWSSDDESVAVVNQTGLVKGLGTGKAKITASLANGKSASCTVSVVEEGLACKFFASNTKSWSVTSSEELYIQSGVAKSYKATMNFSKESLCNIGALYLKDVKCEAGINKMTGEDFYCHVNVKSLKVNGVNIPLTNNLDVDAINDDYVLDMIVINTWAPEKEMVADMPTIGDVTDSRTFEGYPGVTLDDENTVEIEFETLAKKTVPTPPASNNNNNSNTKPVAKPAKKTIKKVTYTAPSATAKTVTVTKVTSKKLTKVTIPSTVKINGKTYKVTKINTNAYKNCKKLKSVTIGANVTSIGKNAFYGCKNLKKITIKSKKLKSVKSGAFKGINKKCKIYVPKAKYKKYKKLLKSKGQKKSVKIIKK